MPIISVIVPVYNVEKYLHRCVDSILAQTFTDFELILVDDGSPDNCGAICDEYAQKDARVRAIHQENEGVSIARNTGIDWVFENSDSEWISFVDSDDWVHPQMLERLYWAVTECDVKISACGHEDTDGDIQWSNSDTAMVRLWPVEQYYVEHNTNAVVIWGKLYHRECFSEIRYPVGKIHEDEYVTYRILFACEQVAVIENPMYAYFSNLEGITKSGWTPKRLDMFSAYEAQIAFFRKGGFKAAYAYKTHGYVSSLAWQCKTLASDTAIQERKKYLSYVQKRLRVILCRYHKYTPFEKKNLWIFEAAYPNFMQAYWHIYAAIEKIAKWNNRKECK